MRVWLQRKRFGTLAAVVAVAGACSTNPAPAPDPLSSPSSPTPTAQAGVGMVSVPVDVASDVAQSPFDIPRQALVPAGWTVTVWARIPKARLALWTPDDRLLVSVPSTGQ